MRFLFILLFWTQISAAKNLFQEPPLSFSSETHISLPAQGVLRQRGMRFDSNGLSKSLENDQSLTLNLFPDLSVKAVIEESKTLEGGGVFHSGQLEGGGYMTLLVSKGGIIMGEVHSPTGTYTIRSDSQDRNNVVIKDIDNSQPFRCGVDHSKTEPVTIDEDRFRRFLLNRDSVTSDYQNFPSSSLETSIRNRNSEDASSLQSGLMQAQNTDPSEDDSETVDVLVVYTTSAKESFDDGDSDDQDEKEMIEAAILLEVQKTNAALRRSGLERQIALVGMREASGYVEYSKDCSSGGSCDSDFHTMSNDLDVLTYQLGDKDITGHVCQSLADEDAVTVDDPCGELDQVHDWRKKYSADLVHLFVGDSSCDSTGCTCGIANIFTSRDETLNENFCSISSNVSECEDFMRKDVWANWTSFSVSTIGEEGGTCSRSNYTFTHELGHNMGIFHDRYTYTYNNGDTALNSSSNFPYKPYAFGYTNQVARPKCWHTIMSYEGDCYGKVGSSDTSLAPLFSNPEVNYGSEINDLTHDDPAGKACPENGDCIDTTDNGPANASRAIEEVWDNILVHLDTSLDADQEDSSLDADQEDSSCGKEVLQDIVYENPFGRLPRKRLSSTRPIIAEGGDLKILIREVPNECDVLQLDFDFLLSSAEGGEGDFMSAAYFRKQEGTTSSTFEMRLKVRGNDTGKNRIGYVNFRAFENDQEKAHKRIAIAQRASR